MTCRSQKVLTLLTIIWVIASCGGGGGDQETGSENSGWVSVSTTRNGTDAEGLPVVYADGEAFVSPSWVAHRCIGMGCLLLEYDNSYPGVDVTFVNYSSQTEGKAVSRYGNLTDWQHFWSAAIPAVPGENRIRINAVDPGGKMGVVEIVVEYTTPTE